MRTLTMLLRSLEGLNDRSHPGAALPSLVLEEGMLDPDTGTVQNVHVPWVMLELTTLADEIRLVRSS